MDADHFWPLDKTFRGSISDLIGSKDGKVKETEMVWGPAYEGLPTGALWIKKDQNKAIDLGDFSGNCPSDFARCQKGITIAFWIRLTAGAASDILYSAKKDSDRGITIFYATTTSSLTIQMYSADEGLKVSVKLSSEVWYHVFVVGQKGTAPCMVINGAEVIWGTVEGVTRNEETHGHLLLGKHPTGGTSNFKVSQLVIWNKALSRADMLTVFHCVGIQAGKFLYFSFWNNTFGLYQSPRGTAALRLFLFLVSVSIVKQ